MAELSFQNGFCMIPEGPHFEAKRARGGLPNNIWESYSAFANTDGGTIVLGLAQNDQKLIVEGVPDSQSVVNQFWNEINNPQKVSVNILEYSRLSVIDVDGKELIVIDVPRASRDDRPVFIDGNSRNSYKRAGEGDYKCSVEEINLMISDSRYVTWDRGVVRTSDVSDFNQETVKMYRNRFSSIKPDHPWNKLGQNEFLKAIGAAIRDQDVLRPTVGGLMMFGCDGAIREEALQYFVDYRQYGIGPEWIKRITNKGEPWSGNLYDFYVLVQNSLKVAIGRPFEIDSNLTRVEDSNLDKALREALINAICNADYKFGGKVTVVCKPNYVQFTNSGTFRIPIEVAMEGGRTDPRNSSIADMFMYIGLVEHAGSGIWRMNHYCDISGVPGPEIREITKPTSVEVTIFLEKKREFHSPTDAAVYEMILEDGSISIEKMADSLGVGKSTIITSLNRMKSDGFVRREGSTRGKWVVV